MRRNILNNPLALISPDNNSWKLDWVPSVSPGDVDMYALAASVASLAAQVDSLTKCLDSAATHRDLENLSKRLESSENFHRWMLPLFLPAATSTLWTSVAGDWAGEMNKRKPPVIQVRGSGQSTNVTAVPRPKIVSDVSVRKPRRIISRKC